MNHKTIVEKISEYLKFIELHLGEKNGRDKSLNFIVDVINNTNEDYGDDIIVKDYDSENNEQE